MMFAVAIAIILLPVAVYIVILGAFVVFQERLIFHPDKARGEPYLAISAPGMPVALRTERGTDLGCWLLSPASPGAPTALYLHGNGGNIAYRAERVQQFARLGWGVFLLGYRGYGGNDGQPSERGLLEDARAGLAMLASESESGPILVWGESLGSGLAVQLAVDTRVQGLVLEAPYLNLGDIVARSMPWLRPALPLLRHRFDAGAVIGRVRCPIIVLMSEEDQVVPPASTRALCALARIPPVLVVLPGGHNALGTTEAFDRIEAYLSPRNRCPI